VVIRATKEDHANLLKKLATEDPVMPGSARWLVELADQWRSRFGGNPWAEESVKPHFSARQARAMALACWLARDEELTYRLVLEGLVSGPDSEFRHDPWIASYIAALGQTDRALADLETKGASLDADQRATKRLYLLRAAGRGKEALAAPGPTLDPHAYLEIAVEHQEWELAMKATAHAIESPEKSTITRQFIAILSRDPVLAAPHGKPVDRTLLLLAGGESGFIRQALGAMETHPVSDGDLRAMAMDALLATTYEARLTQALSAGEPVPLELMQEYLRFADLLPDHARAAKLVSILAAQPRCQSLHRFESYPAAERERLATDSHRWVAAEALLRLGLGDASFAALRPVLEARPEVAEPCTSGYYTNPLRAAWQQGIILAKAAWPDLPYTEQIEKLAVFAGEKDPSKRALALIALARDHGKELGKKELLRWLWLPLCDLAQGDGVPAEVSTAAMELLASRTPDDADRKLLAHYQKPLGPEAHSVARAQARMGDLKVTFKHAPVAPPAVTPRGDFGGFLSESLPGKWNPHAADFTVFDGLCAIKVLLDQQQRDEADRLMSDLTKRVYLDESLMDQEVEASLDAKNGTYGSRRDVPVPELILFCHAAWGFPAEWLYPHAGTCCHGDPGYFANPFDTAALAFEKAGRIAEAANMQRLYLLKCLSQGTLVEPREVGTYVRLELLAAARRGDRDAFLEWLKDSIRLMPYYPESGKEALASWPGATIPAPAKEVADVIHTYWNAKALEVPDSKTYAHWQKRWLEETGLK